MAIAFKILLIATIILAVATWISKAYAKGDRETQMALYYNTHLAPKDSGVGTKPLFIFMILLILTIICAISTIIVGIIHYL